MAVASSSSRLRPDNSASSDSLPTAPQSSPCAASQRLCRWRSVGAGLGQSVQWEGGRYTVRSVGADGGQSVQWEVNRYSGRSVSAGWGQSVQWEGGRYTARSVGADDGQSVHFVTV